MQTGRKKYIRTSTMRRGAQHSTRPRRRSLKIPHFASTAEYYFCFARLFSRHVMFSRSWSQMRKGSSQLDRSFLSGVKFFAFIDELTIIFLARLRRNSAQSLIDYTYGRRVRGKHFSDDRESK